MLHAEVSGRTEGERGNQRAGTEKALIVAVVGYAVCTVGVVVHEAKIVCCSSEDLGELTQMIEALGYGSGSAGFVAV